MFVFLGILQQPITKQLLLSCVPIQINTMSTPLDYFEQDRPTPAPAVNRRLLGIIYWVGLSLMNGLLGMIWWKKWDAVLSALGAMVLYLIAAFQVAYITHLLIHYFLFATSQAFIRGLLRRRSFRWSNRIKGLFSTLKLGLLSQILILLYLLSQIFS